ncbi:DUF6907 domain-containing protein [Streptomyces sp. NPDC101118]|uniref:DUF6907 domain-containing protein n=1 Tax=Streptomyces sp. NPDC101118 TaxID=3366109 RepID=UPI00382413E7
MSESLPHVTVLTADHGPVTFPEPNWCLGVHPDGGARADIHHQGAEQPGTFTVERYGRLEFLTAFLSQYPYAEIGSRRVTVAVDINGDHVEFNSGDLGDLAASLTAHALYTLLPLRARLQALEGDE